MTQIWKCPLDIAQDLRASVMMPQGARILSAGEEDGTLMLWAVVDPGRQTVRRPILVRGTGHPSDHSDGRFVGTVHMASGLVWHVFDTMTEQHVVGILRAARAEGAQAERAGVLGEIADERQRQDAKWGEQNHPSLDIVLLNRPGGCTPERMAEQYEIPSEARAKFLCQTNAERGTCTYAHILIEEVAEAIAAGVTSEDALRTELVQTAAVVVAWIEKIDRARGQQEASDICEACGGKGWILEDTLFEPRARDAPCLACNSTGRVPVSS